MLGNITIRREELKIKDYDTYRSFYCGICQDIRENCGEAARLTLTYDMTFLAILLTSLYDTDTSSELHRCMLRPGPKKSCLRNRYTAYAADLCVILTYHNLLDDWKDEKKQKSLLESRLLLTAYQKSAKRHPETIESLRRYLKSLKKAEEKNAQDLDLAAGLTGRFFRELFLVEDDPAWREDLGEVGYYLGKFIYLLDAYIDIEDDLKNGNYNPFRSICRRDNFSEYVQEILTMMAGEAARAYERLPLVGYTRILSNILYGGIWNKFIEVRNKREKK